MANRNPPAKHSDVHAVIGEVYRAHAILSCFIKSLDEDRAADRYVLWVVEEILGDLPRAIDRLPVAKEVAHG